jgi:hypothetical protein
VVPEATGLLYMRQNKVPPERRGRMEEISFNSELQSEKNERIWNEKFQCLKKYRLKHGDSYQER